MVELRPRYVRVARQIAAERTESFLENDAWDTEIKTYGVDAETRNVRGVIGELGFADYAGLAIDTDQYETTDGGGDFEIRYEGERVTVDVKAADTDPYALFVKEGTVNADYYVLAALDDRVVDLIGWTDHDTVLDQGLSPTPYDHKNYEVPIAQLDEIPAAETLHPVG